MRKVPTPVAGLVLQQRRTWMRDHGDEDMTNIVAMLKGWSGVEVEGDDTDRCPP
jgi:hypothetical protein